MLGPAAQAYFDLVRKAREAVKIPETYAAPKTTLTVAPDEVEDAFVKSQSRTFARRHRGDLRQHAAERSPHLHEQGFEIPRLRARSTAGPAGATSCSCRRCVAASVPIPKFAHHCGNL